MTITSNQEIIFNDNYGNTQYITKEELKRAWEFYKQSKKSCANYERDNNDPIVESVRQKLLDRSTVGIAKYGMTLKDNTKDNYLNHLQMELMDAANYLEVLLQQEKDITQIVKNEPHDETLGKKIRSVYGSQD